MIKQPKDYDTKGRFDPWDWDEKGPWLTQEGFIKITLLVIVGIIIGWAWL